MNRNLIFFFVFSGLFIICHKISGQNNISKIDSLKILIATEEKDTNYVKFLFDISAEYFDDLDMDSTLKYYSEALKLSKELNYTRYIAIAHQQLAHAFLQINDYKNAYENYLQAIFYFDKLNNKRTLAYTHICIGYLYQKLGNFGDAINSFQKSLKISKEINYKSYIALSIGNIGHTMVDFNKNIEALEYLNQALELYKELGYNTRLSWILEKIGDAYFGENNYDKALSFYEESLVYFKETVTSRYIGVYRKIGDVYVQKNNLNKAMKHYQDAISFHKEKNDHELALDLLSVGSLYESKGEKEKALIYYNDALSKARDVQSKFILLKNYEKLFNLHLKNKNYTKFLENFELYSSIKDSIFNEKNNNLLIQMQLKFEEEKRIQEAIQAKQEARIKRTENIALTSGIILFIVIIGSFYARQRNRFKINRAQKALLEAELKNTVLEKKNLKDELNYKNKELQNLAIHIVQKNNFIETLNEKIKEIKVDLTHEKNLNGIRNISNFITQSMSINKDRKEFSMYIESLHQNFFFQLKKRYPDLTKNEQRLAALLRLNFSSKEIAVLYNISIRSAETYRHRLRKKMNIQKEEDISEFLNRI